MNGGQHGRGLTLEIDSVAETRFIDAWKALGHEAGFAVVPFQAFGLPGETGWARLSVGAVSLDEVRGGLARVRALLEDARA